MGSIPAWGMRILPVTPPAPQKKAMLLIFKFSSIFSSAGFSGEREPTVHLQMCVCVCVCV